MIFQKEAESHGNSNGFLLNSICHHLHVYHFGGIKDPMRYPVNMEYTLITRIANGVFIYINTDTSNHHVNDF